MAEADWTFCADVLTTASVLRGVTNGIARPSGGGNFVYGFNSIDVSLGAVALFANGNVGAGFAPMAKGCSISAAIQRGLSGGVTNFSPFIFCQLGGTSVNDNGYLLGLEDADPHKIVLRKGSLIGGVPSASLGSSGVLRKSTATFSAATWLHIRLDAIVQPNGDVTLQMFRNDLGAHVVTSPTWAAEPGLEAFTDDVLGVNSGSVPYTSGRGGYGFRTSDVTRRAFFDQLVVLKQL